jgi:8-amino-7-oxononanoate synthase
VETGVAPGQPGDAANAAATAGPRAKAYTLFSFLAPLAPPAAAARENKRIDFEAVIAACRALPACAAIRIYEGAGGIATPLDDAGHDWADLAAALGIEEIIIVVPDRLGAINHSRLCAARAKACGLKPRIWLNAITPPPADVAASNRECIASVGLELVDETTTSPWAEASCGSGVSPLASDVAAPADPAARRLAPHPEAARRRFHLPARWRTALDSRRAAHLLRQIRVRDTACDQLNLADNDYLDLARDPAVIAAAADSLRHHGTSAAASPLITGWKSTHETLVQTLCGWLGFSHGLLWTSGYAANSAVLGTLPEKGDLIFADRLIHASMVAGLVRSGARFKRYPHLDLDRLELELSQAPSDAGTAFVVTETIFSMDGDYPDLRRLAQLKRDFGFILIVDEAHGLGWYGPEGAGLVAEAGIAPEVDILVGTLGKTLGAGGAFTLFHDATLRDYLINFAGEFIYSTGMPPANAAAASAAISRVRALSADQRSWRRRAALFRQRLRSDGWQVCEGDSPIIPVPMNSEGAAVAAAAALEGQGILAAAVRPPTVPAGTSRLRFSIKRTFDEPAMERVLSTLRPLRNRPRIAWLLGWAIPESWFAEFAREFLPNADHHFVAPSPAWREDLARVGPCDWIVGYSLGSLLLLSAAGAVAGGLSRGGARGPHALFDVESGTAGVAAPGHSASEPSTSNLKPRRIALLAPIWSFPAESNRGGRIPRASLRALTRQAKVDAQKAAITFYRTVGLEDAATHPCAQSTEALIWGLEQLDRLTVDCVLPSEWYAVTGADDPLLEATQLTKKGVSVVPGTHHPRALIAAFAAHAARVP